MDDREATRKIEDAIVVYLHPDVCKSPVAPVPYPITANFKSCINVPPSVRATGVPIFTRESLIPGVLGDEGGVGGGVASGTFAGGGMNRPTSWSGTVRAKGANVVANTHHFQMNSGNTDGKVVYQPPGSAARVGEDGKPTKDTNPKSRWGRFKDGFTGAASEWWNGVTGQLGTLADASGLNGASQEAVDAARSSIWQGAKNMGSLASDVGIASTPGMAFTPWGQDALGRLGDKASAVGTAVANRYKGAYAQGGLSQAAGVGSFDALRVVGEVLATKGAGMAAEAGTEGLVGLGEAANAATKVEEAANVATKVEEAANVATKAEEAANVATKAEEAANVATKGEEAANAATKGEEAASAANKTEEGASAANKAEKAEEGAKDGVRVVKKAKRPDTSNAKYRDAKAYQDENGNWKWPDNNGFDGPPKAETLDPGTRIDRFGSEGGKFTSPEGTPFEQRALAPTSLDSPYNAYEVAKPLPVQSGQIAPAFDQPGGGIQYLLPDKVENLVRDGYLVRIPQ